MADPRPRPRVLLVEDDAALRRFVQLALEELDLALVECASVDEALDALRAAPVRLVVTDLGLGRGQASGLTLLERLGQDAALRGDARLVVFSAGLTPEIEARLRALPVWRVLRKPVPLRELEDCVREALVAGAPAGAESMPPAAGPASLDGESDAIARHFGGDAALYAEFRAGCLAQFPRDLAAGDAACRAGDAPALRCVAHNLKSVLRLLGHASIGERAATVEALAAAADTPGAAQAWSAGVREPLLLLLARGAA